jgi:hypothetical protein
MSTRSGEFVTLRQLRAGVATTPLDFYVLRKAISTSTSISTGQVAEQR